MERPVAGSRKRKATEQPEGAARVGDAPNKGYVGVRWRQYPYGIRFIPRVRVPKTRYDLPLGEYRTCEEAALVRDVAAFYYGKKGTFNFDNDHLACLPEMASELSRQEKIDWVSARAKERGKVFSASQQANNNPSSSSSLPLPRPLSFTPFAPQPVSKAWPPAPVVPSERLALENYVFLQPSKLDR